MKSSELINQIEQLDQLIRMKATGKPKQLANRLQISEASLFRLLEVMKKLNAPLKYDIYLQSYIYEHEVSFEFGFYTIELSMQRAKEINGGFNNTLTLQSEGVAHWQTACYNNFVSLLIYKPRPH